MAWELLVKQQMTSATVLFGKALTKWQQAKAPGYTANDAVRAAVELSQDALELWWGPLLAGGRPVAPTMLITGKAGSGPRHGDVRLDHDTTTAKVSVTDLIELGGTTKVAGAVHTVTDGAKLTVEVPALPGTLGLYQGYAVEGGEVVAVIVLRVI